MGGMGKSARVRASEREVLWYVSYVDVEERSSWSSASTGRSFSADSSIPVDSSALKEWECLIAV
jgi:hypothetical protein